MSRSANTLSALKSAPGVLGSANTIVVLLASAGDVELVILDGFLQHLEAEHFRGASRRECRRAGELLLGNQLGASRRVVDSFDGRSQILQVSLALRQRLRVRVDDRDLIDLGARQRLQTVDDIELDLAADREVVIEQEVVVAVDRAADRVLERNHAMRRAPLRDRVEDVLEALAGQGLGLRAAVLQRRRLSFESFESFGSFESFT